MKHQVSPETVCYIV